MSYLEFTVLLYLIISYSSLVMLFVLAGCNTVKGIGEDVSSAGNAVSNTAEKTQDEIRK